MDPRARVENAVIDLAYAAKRIYDAIDALQAADERDVGLGVSARDRVTAIMREGVSSLIDAEEILNPPAAGVPMKPKTLDPPSDGLPAVWPPEARRSWKLRRILQDQQAQAIRRVAL